MRRLYIFILAILFISSSLCAQNSDGNSNGLWVTVKTPSELNIPKVINNQYIFEIGV